MPLQREWRNSKAEDVVALCARGAGQGWRAVPQLRVLHLLHDALPAASVTMIVTEHGMVPPSSVPVILREYQRDYALTTK